jgi:ABC-type arginine/histidine transport system permease subunit
LDTDGASIAKTQGNLNAASQVGFQGRLEPAAIALPVAIAIRLREP